MLTALQQWTRTRNAWMLLCLSAAGLLAAALYFQHVLGLAPCIMCIYQRTAVIGLLLSASIVLIQNSRLSRYAGFAGWLVSAIWGFRLSSEHIDILTAPNPFFASCDAIPNFPSFMPLHTWMPNVFGAPGDCLENSWQFMSMGMAQWMQIIFAAYAVVGIICLALHLSAKPEKSS